MSIKSNNISRERQAGSTANSLIAASPNPLVSRRIGMDAGEHDPPHSHPWHQLIYPHRGVLKTRVGQTLHHVPCNRAVLIPAGTGHESWAVTPVAFVGLYLSPELMALAPGASRLLAVTPFLRELVLQLQSLGESRDPASEATHRLIEVLRDQLVEQADVGLELLIPTDKRLQPIVETLVHRPDSTRSLASWAGQVGASQRTISRLFEQQTGLTFERWRRRARLISALPLLEQKTKIPAVAAAVGFASASSFIYSFRREFGVTPGRYFD